MAVDCFRNHVSLFNCLVSFYNIDVGAESAKISDKHRKALEDNRKSIVNGLSYKGVFVHQLHHNLRSSFDDSLKFEQVRILS